MPKYTDERNILILISLLKKHGIKTIIASPGTTNISFVASVQSDPFFSVISCVDERSAAYIACGMAAETNEPVVLTCTGATASRNYAPGLTEAFYRKLPIVAVTATQHLGRVGQNVPQVLDRSTQFADLVKKSIQLHEVHTDEDAWACNVSVNDTLLEVFRNGGGPVHINMVTSYSNNFDEGALPAERKISRINASEELPAISYNKVAVFIGAHKKIEKKLQSQIEEFCEKYNGVVLCDHPSGYDGKYKIIPNLVTVQSTTANLKNIDFLIDLGEVSGIYADLRPKEVWRVSEDGDIKDTFRKLTNIFAMPEESFFAAYNAKKTSRVQTSYYDEWKKKKDSLDEKLSKKELPFSNIWITRQIAPKLKSGDIAHLAILNTLRSWDLCESSPGVRFYSNTGGFGIDGILSTALGNSLVTDNKVFCFIGDLAFFYDLNSIGNKNLKNNLRILLVNNGCGTEFHNFNHRAAKVSSSCKLSPEFFAADGHYGNKSSDLVKHYAEDLGFRYLHASSKEEFLEQIDDFVSAKSDKPLLFEVFTNDYEESNALKEVCNLDKSPKTMTKKLIKKIIRK